ncbi:MAG: DUF445 family protein [Dehalobacter sp.]|nr:DUF445 family protein [Dehalobacter sp.]
MNLIQIAAGPVIGAIIGYVTNYIAVKMLFRPINPIKIGNWTLPFTPGIFPKRKGQLAKALGNAVGNNLLTSKDVENMFLSENIKNTIVQEISSSLYEMDERHTLKNIFTGFVSQDAYQVLREQAENIICSKIMSGVSRMDVGTIIAREGRRAMKEKIHGTMLALMVNDQLIASVAAPIGAKVDAYIQENGQDTIRSIVREELAVLENQPVATFMQKIEIEEKHLTSMVDRIYSVFVQKKLGGYIQQFDIAGVVEKKVNDMDVLEIERLVLSVMKNELNAVVNLGALIGFVIGLLNLLLK